MTALTRLCLELMRWCSAIYGFCMPLWLDCLASKWLTPHLKAISQSATHPA